MSNQNYYAVAKGRQVGIYRTWADCQQQVNGYSGPKFKKFSSQADAEAFIKQYESSSSSSNSVKPFYTSSIPASKSVNASTSFTAANASNAFRNSTPPKVTKYQPAKANGRGNGGTDNNKSKFVPLKLSGCVSVKGKIEDCDGPVVYTDGACGANGKKGANGGIGVWWGRNHPDNLSEKLEGRQTNNRAEIQAAVRAIEQAKAKGHKQICIRTDSNFLIQSATEWMSSWQKKNWKLSTGEDVKNKEDFVDLLNACRDMEKVVWDKVRGHSGDFGNDQADRLAREGAFKRARPTGDPVEPREVEYVPLTKRARTGNAWTSNKSNK